MKSFAFIPARGGSKGIPGKNIKLMNGIPLIGYTLEAALRSNVDKVVLSSDSERVHSIAQDYIGRNLPGMANRLAHHIRPAKISGDHSPISEAIVHFIQSNPDYGQFDLLLLLQPTSPIRQVAHINDAIQKISDSNIDTLVSVSEPMQHPAEMAVIDDKGFRFFLEGSQNVQRQDYERVFFVNGSIYAAKLDFFLGHERFIDKNTDVLIMDAISSLDVDTYDEFFIAEAVISHKQYE